jgi:hypothetical protein
VEENKNPGFSSEDFTRERLNLKKEQGCDYSLEKRLLFCNFLVPYAFSVFICKGTGQMIPRERFNPEMQYMEEKSQWFLEIYSLVGTSSF